MSTLTITEFLEARILDDEMAANDLMGEREGDRVLAECAAKRAIIEYHSMLLEQSEHSDVAGYHATGMRIATRALAAVYKDHPDYQQEWELA
jgi:hypothetical protein